MTGDKLLHLITEQGNTILVRASHIRVLWIGATGTGCVLYVADCRHTFDLTEESAKEAAAAMEELP